MEYKRAPAFCPVQHPPFHSPLEYYALQHILLHSICVVWKAIDIIYIGRCGQLFGVSGDLLNNAAFLT